MKIGVIREGKNPPDKRVPLTPEQCKQFVEKFDAELVVQPVLFVLSKTVNIQT